MRHPSLGSVINVREGSVQRFADAGYVEVKSESKKKSAPKKASSDESDE